MLEGEGGDWVDLEVDWFKGKSTGGAIPEEFFEVSPFTINTPSFLSQQACAMVPFPQQKLPSSQGVTVVSVPALSSILVSFL